MRTDWNGASHAMWWFSNVSIKLHGGIAHLHSRHNMVYVGAGTPGPAHALWAGHCCMWLRMVHVCEHIYTFEVLGEHPGICKVISLTAHLHIWRYVLIAPHERGAGAPRQTDCHSRFCCIWLRMVHMCEHIYIFEVLGEHSGMCKVISLTAHLHIWRDMLRVGTNTPEINDRAHRFWADFAVYGYVWYTCVSIYILLKC